MPLPPSPLLRGGVDHRVPQVLANKPAVLTDGRWVLPFWREPGKTCPVVRSRVPSSDWVNGSAGVLVTGDQGLTWRAHGNIVLKVEGLRG